jgi:hypothetical protein
LSPKLDTLQQKLDHIIYTLKMLNTKLTPIVANPTIEIMVSNAKLLNNDIVHILTYWPSIHHNSPYTYTNEAQRVQSYIYQIVDINMKIQDIIKANPNNDSL